MRAYLCKMLVGLLFFHICSAFAYSIQTTPDVLKEVSQRNFQGALKLIDVRSPTNLPLVTLIKVKSGDINGAIALISNSLTNQEIDVYSFSDACNVLIEDGDKPDIALTLLKKFEDQHRSFDPEIQIGIASALFKKGEVDESIMMLKSVVTNNYTDTTKSAETFLFRVIASKYVGGKSREALDLYDLLYHINPQLRLEPGNMLQWANIAINVGRPVEALANIAKIQSYFPQYVTNNFVLVELGKGRAFDAIQDWPHALQALSNIVNLAKSGDKMAITYASLANRLIDEVNYNIKYTPRSISTEQNIASKKFAKVRVLIMVMSIMVLPVIIYIVALRRFQKKR